MKKNPIGKYLLQNWYYYVFAFGSMALSVFLDMLAPLVTLHIVDDVLVSHKMELLWKYLAAFLLIGAAKALFQYIKEFLFDVSSVRVASQMRETCSATSSGFRWNTLTKTIPANSSPACAMTSTGSGISSALPAC